MTCRQASTATLASQACGLTDPDSKSNISPHSLTGLKNSYLRPEMAKVSNTKALTQLFWGTEWEIFTQLLHSNYQSSC